LEQAVSTMFDVPLDELRATGRCKSRAAFARQVAMYLAHTVFGVTLTRVGTMFGRDRTTVAHACAVVEDRRDAPRLDRALCIVESALRRAHYRNQTAEGDVQ
jgi:chromosomal replication initiation ATPase DnaA